MKKILLSMTISLLLSYSVNAQLKLSAAEFKSLSSVKASFDKLICQPKAEYNHIFQHLSTQPSTGINWIMAELTVVFHPVKNSGVSSFYSSSYYNVTKISCTKIDLTGTMMRNERNVDALFGGFHNPTTGTITVEFPVGTTTLRGNVTLAPAVPGQTNSIFTGTGTDTSGKYLVSVVLNLKRATIIDLEGGATILD